MVSEERNLMYEVVEASIFNKIPRERRDFGRVRPLYVNMFQGAIKDLDSLDRDQVIDKYVGRGKRYKDGKRQYPPAVPHIPDLMEAYLDRGFSKEETRMILERILAKL